MSELEKLFSIEWLPLGTLINAFCILMGGLVGLRLSRQLPDSTQHRIRRFLAVLTFLAGSYMIANGLHGGWKEHHGRQKHGWNRRHKKPAWNQSSVVILISRQ